MPCFRLFVFIAVSALSVCAQSFSFNATVRAGRPAGGDWELGIGNNPSASNSTASFNYLEIPGNLYWRPFGQPQNFQLGWTAATNTAYLTVFNAFGSPTTVTFANTGTPLSTSAIWTLPANSFFASAAGRPQNSSISLENLSFSPGVQVLSGALPSSFSAAQTGTTVSTNLSAPIVINPASNGGNWFISGSVRFSGLTNSGGISSGSQLQFMLNAVGANSAVPEASTSAMIGCGLLALVAVQRRMRRSAKSA